MASYIRVVAYYERWSGKFAFHGWHPSVQSTPIIADKPSDGRDFHPRPYLFKEYPRQPRLGWNPNADPDVTRPVPDTHFTTVRPWPRWQPQPWLGWNAAQDTGVDTPPPWVPVTGWKGWQPQPRLGWNPASDVGIAPTPSDTPFNPLVVAYYERWSAKFAYLGWNLPTDTTAPPPPPDTPPPQGTRPWPKGYTLQPQLGWNAAQDVGTTQEGEAEQLLLLWERAWTLQPWLGWNPNPETGAVPLVDTPPPPVLHPYLFLPYRLQPQLGWGTAADVPPVIAPPTARRSHTPMFIRRIELYNQRNW